MDQGANFLNRDQIEIFKPFVEVSKYIISIVIALVSVFTLLAKNSPEIEWSSGVNMLVASLGILLSVSTIFAANRVAAEATDAISRKHTIDSFEKSIRDLRRKSYSVLAIMFLISIFFWMFVFLTMIIGL